MNDNADDDTIDEANRLIDVIDEAIEAADGYDNPAAVLMALNGHGATTALDLGIPKAQYMALVAEAYDIMEAATDEMRGPGGSGGSKYDG